MPDAAVLRILDANWNRASEGLRVLEEYARFKLNDSFLVSEFKKLRHELTAVMSQLDRAALFSARDTRHDVGTVVRTEAEYQRATAQDVVAANGSRVEQALRTLEEYSKVVGLDAASFEALRYRAYSLHRSLLGVAQSRERFSHAQLYILIEAASSDDELQAQARQLVEAGVSVLQLRDKSCDDRILLQRARVVRQVTRNSETLFIMNDRADLAALSDADGVHLGQEDLDVHDAKRIIGTDKLIGVSTHNFAQVERAIVDGANYIGCGPTFPSVTKDFAEFPGLPFLREVSNRVSIPAFAIGGINELNLTDVLATGCSRVAVGSAICRASNPPEAARRFLDRLGKWSQVP